MAPFRPLGIQELADRWGVTRQRIYQLLDEDPALRDVGVQLRGGWVFDGEELEKYEADRPGRRRPPPEPVG